jgi:hypothetical protein
MKLRSVRAASLAAIVLGSAACVSPSGDTPNQQWQSARAMHDEYMQLAKADDPELASALATAPGYFVMDQFVLKILLLGTSSGYGVLVDNRDGSMTVLDNFTLALGPGIEIARIGGVGVFADAAALDEVKAGVTEFGGDAEAAFQFGDFGGAARATDTGPAVENYPIFIGGVALHASVFWAFLSRDDEMNMAR